MKKLLYTLFVSGFFSFCASAQTIPNSSFENWTTQGPFNSPDGWAVSPGISQSNDYHSGSYAVKLVVDTFTNPRTSQTDTISPMIYTGAQTMGPPTMGKPTGGFAFTGKVDSLFGFYKLSSKSNDTLIIFIELSYWDTKSNSRQIIARGHYADYQNKSNYTRFSCPVNYMNSSISPDTAKIQVMLGNRNAKHIGSSAIIDDLGIKSLTSGIELFDNNEKSKLVIYPNPSTKSIQITGQDVSSKGYSIYDQMGKNVSNGIIANSAIQLDLPAGLYFLRIQGINQAIHLMKE